MKRIIYFLLILCILLFALALSVKPLILFIAKRQLSQVFTNSTVKIGACALKPLKQLSLLDIEIKKEPLYAFKVGQIGFDFSPLSILKGRIFKVTLQDVRASLNFGQKSILEFNKQLNLGSAKPPFSIDYLELTQLSLDLNSKEINIKARFSLAIDLSRQRIEQCDLGIEALDSFGISLENATLKEAQLSAGGTLNIAKAKYDKAALSQIQGRVRLTGSSLFLDALSAKLFNGWVQGNLSLKLDKDAEYKVELEFIDLDLDTFVKDFALEEKLKLSGKLNGSVKLQGRGAEIKTIAGNFKVNDPGGTLTISDTQYLEKMARNSSQSLDILVESFKDYRYNNGRLNLSLEQGNPVFDVILEGETGKRNLSVILHDFNLGRRQQ